MKRHTSPGTTNGYSAADSRSAVPGLRGHGATVVENWSPLSEIMEPDKDAWIDQACGRVAEQINELMTHAHDVLDPEERLMDITRQLKHLVDQQRRNTLLAMLRYFWHDADNPWEAMKRLLAATRRIKADLIKGISQKEAGLLLNESVRATQNAREKRVYTDFVARWGMKGFLGTGGVKPATASGTYSRVQQGNHNRRKGEKRRRVKEALGARRGSRSEEGESEK